MTDTEILDRLLEHINSMQEVCVYTITNDYAVTEYWRGYDHAQATAKNLILSEREAAL